MGCGCFPLAILPGTCRDRERDCFQQSPQALAQALSLIAANVPSLLPLGSICSFGALIAPNGMKAEPQGLFLGWWLGRL